MAQLSPRQSDILRLVREQGSCTVATLADTLNVSFETIRRDLKPLAASREILKRHGSVSMPYELGEAPMERRMR
ncbi:DeoR family transcriptional regulator [Aestuariivirga sp.]|uniref:DeoR family transcriptional regulator n=1 Tax=Aestuariivirga sp. TaxID=2650926 RepID=UPI0039E2D769